MQHSLTDMIDEINAAPNNLTSTHNAQSSSSAPGSEDPLADIVRVLNVHLTQLQAIDEGAEALKGKVAAAQRESRVLGEGVRGAVNGRGDAFVEGFGKSYLGRRRGWSLAGTAETLRSRMSQGW